jgi:hypothetical protein
MTKNQDGTSGLPSEPSTVRFRSKSVRLKHESRALGSEESNGPVFTDGKSGTPYAMTLNGKSPSSNSSHKPGARLRIIGVIVLLLGMAGACIVYWVGSRSADLRDDPMMAGYYKAESRQVEVLIGKMGLVLVELLDDLKRPGTQAIIIAATSAIVAFGCFYFARLLEYGGYDDDETG